MQALGAKREGDPHLAKSRREPQLSPRRVAAPAALTEHRWLAKLSSHTTWRRRVVRMRWSRRSSCAHIISRVTRAQTRRGARLRSFD